MGTATIYNSLSVQDTTVNLLVQPPTDTFTHSVTGTVRIENIQTINGTTAEALVMGDLASAGIATFRNQSTVATNYILVGRMEGTNFVDVIKVWGGNNRWGPVCLSTAAPYAATNTGSQKLDYFIMEA